MLTLLMAFSLVALPLTADPKKEVDRLDNCGMVLKEIMDIPDDIPSDLIDKAECVIVIPSVLKVAFAFSGSYGRGAMTCRTGEHFTGPWSAPAMMRLEGGGFGLQLGGQATDFVILVMNPRGAKALLKSKVKLGADAAAANFTLLFRRALAPRGFITRITKSEKKQRKIGGRRRPQGTRRCCGQRRHHARRDAY